jgi:hypothetical protein
VEKQMECRLAGKTEVLGENLPQRHFCPSQNPTLPDPGLNPGRGSGKPCFFSLFRNICVCSSVSGFFPESCIMGFFISCLIPHFHCVLQTRSKIKFLCSHVPEFVTARTTNVAFSFISPTNCSNDMSSYKLSIKLVSASYEPIKW